MNRSQIIFILASVLLVVFPASAQTKPPSTPTQISVSPVKSSAAYAEILLRRTDLEADLEDFMVTYTEDYPKVKETRYELGLINAFLNKLLTVNASESSKLTLALGKLLVRKAELETNLWSLKTKYGDDHPDVRRMSRKVAAFEKAVREILP